MPQVALGAGADLPPVASGIITAVKDCAYIYICTYVCISKYYIRKYPVYTIHVFLKLANINLV